MRISDSCRVAPRLRNPIHYIRLLGATITKAVYGLESRGRDDKYLKIADDVVRRGATAAVPGAFLVDIIPARKITPACSAARIIDTPLK